MSDVTHDDLRREITAAREQSATNARSIDKLRDRLGVGDVNFATIHSDLDQIHNTLKEMRETLKELVASENQRKGRDGFAAALLKHPMTWLAALGAGLGVVISAIKGWLT